MAEADLRKTPIEGSTGDTPPLKNGRSPAIPQFMMVVEKSFRKTYHAPSR
jgi:hypothetical protein